MVFGKEFSLAIFCIVDGHLQQYLDAISLMAWLKQY